MYHRHSVVIELLGTTAVVTPPNGDITIEGFPTDELAPEELKRIIQVNVTETRRTMEVAGVAVVSHNIDGYQTLRIPVLGDPVTIDVSELSTMATPVRFLSPVDAAAQWLCNAQRPVVSINDAGRRDALDTTEPFGVVYVHETPGRVLAQGAIVNAAPGDNPDHLNAYGRVATTSVADMQLMHTGDDAVISRIGEICTRQLLGLGRRGVPPRLAVIGVPHTEARSRFVIGLEDRLGALSNYPMWLFTDFHAIAAGADLWRPPNPA